MSETKTNLRQAEAKVNVEGVVSEKDLKVVTENNETKIEGSLTVKTDETNFIRFRVSVNEKTKAGAENKTFAGIKTVMEEYKSIAEVGEENADKVRVSGDINLYQNQNNGQEVISYKSNFFNRLKNPDEFDPHATFSVEMFISSIVPEMDAEQEETGRILVKGWVPTFNGIEPITIVAPAEDDIAGAVESSYEPGQTVMFDGDIINARVEKVTEIPMKIGKPKRKVETTYKNELIITGSSEAYEEGITPTAPYEAETIKAAIQERKNRLEEAKAKAQNEQKATAKPSGAAKGRTLGF